MNGFHDNRGRTVELAGKIVEEMEKLD